MKFYDFITKTVPKEQGNKRKKRKIIHRGP